jgi:hypothetical protein
LVRKTRENITQYVGNIGNLDSVVGLGDVEDNAEDNRDIPLKT